MLILNPNVAVHLTDMHVVATGDPGGLGEMYQEEVLAFTRHLNSMVRPSVAVLGGDARDHYRAATTEHELFRDYFLGGLAMPYIHIPGNHDERYDSNEVQPTDFTQFDTIFPAEAAAGYHSYIDWEAPNVRFITVHSAIIHSPSVDEGFWVIATDEITWLSDRLDELGVGQKAIIVFHPPVLTAFGGNIKTNQASLLSLLATNNSKVLSVLSGHRHLVPTVAVQDGITHIAGGTMAYTTSNSRGYFSILEYDGVNSIFIRYHYATPPYGSIGSAIYTPVELSLS